MKNKKKANNSLYDIVSQVLNPVIRFYYCNNINI